MLKKIISALFVTLSLTTFSYAVTGQPPIPSNGFGAVDGTWLNGLAGGLNNLYIYGLTAAGTNQTTAAQLPSGYYLMEADTVASGTGFDLPPAYQGTDLLFYNNGNSTVTIYPNVINNPITGIQDTINNTTSVTVASHSSQSFSCAKNGIWFSK